MHQSSTSLSIIKQWFQIYIYYSLTCNRENGIPAIDTARLAGLVYNFGCLPSICFMATLHALTSTLLAWLEGACTKDDDVRGGKEEKRKE